ncbi:MAG: hypothetical protein HONBIEJF_02285 [Fimbriimonadaceae bacterium]|nr:hypothetical protein [Fimbriimonadaceae bacterium]
MNNQLRILSFLATFGAVAVAVAQDPIIGPQVRMDPAGGTFAAHETSAASIDPLGLEVIGTWNDWRRSGASEIINMGVGSSIDGGLTFTDFLVRPPAANQSSVEGDPMTAYDNRTGTLWVGAIGFSGNGGVYVARKNAGANSFMPSVMVQATGSADKCWMAAGPAPGNPNATRVYVSYNLGTSRSTDMGATWSAPVGTGSGIGFLPRVGPEGNVYVAYWDFGTGHWLRKSTDGGATFQAAIKIVTRLSTWGTQDGSKAPGNFRKPPMSSIAVDPNSGVLYHCYFDQSNIVNGKANLDLWFNKSTNQGATWSAPVKLDFTPGSEADQIFPWIEVDQRGRIHLAWWDTRHVANQSDGLNGNGFYDNYYAYSDDGGNTWKEFRLTPASWNCNNDGLNRSQQFMGDYNALAYGGEWAYPCYPSTQNGNPDVFTNRILDPRMFVEAENVQFGSVTGGVVADMMKNDGVRHSFKDGMIPNASLWPVTVEWTGTSKVKSPTKFGFFLDSQVNAGGLNQRIELRNQTNGTWELLDQRAASVGNDQIVEAYAAGDLSRFVDQTTNAVRARFRVKGGPAFLGHFTTSVDTAVWMIGR